MSVPKKSDHIIYLSLGSNIHPEENLPKAIELLSKYVQVISISNAWKTPAVGSEGPDFLNAVVLIRTGLNKNRLKLEVLRPIENQMGRVRSLEKNAPRTIDLDILIIDGIVTDNELWHQVHLAVPFAELNSDYTHPVSGFTISDIARQLSSLHEIQAQPQVFKNYRTDSHNT